MKKLVKLLYLITIALTFYSCNNNFEPNAPFRERYALNGIMRSDTNLQVVTLSKSYEPANGINPLTNTEDPSIANAQVNMWYRDTLYQMRDTTIARQDTSRYTDSVHYYYVNNLKPEGNQYIDIEVLLPNGILLKSSTQLPDVEPGSFFDKSSDISVPPLDTNQNDITVRWKLFDNTIYSPKINIIYYVKGSPVEHKWEVPLYYTTENGQDTAIYPQPTKTNWVSVSMETIEKVLNQIPQGGNRHNFSITNLNVEVVVYDVNLSTYYLSLQNGLDAFTVRLDPPDYSDIQGGYGIFGSYYRIDYNIPFSYNYLRSLGFEFQ
jgi:hypothetical protein